MAKIIIIGNGIAGTTAAIHTRKLSNHEITMISGETQFPFSRTALMYVFMGHLKVEHTKLYEDWFWEKNKINLVHGWVVNIQTNTKKIRMSDGTELTYDKLILATGSKSNKLGVPGENVEGVQGLYHIQDLQTIELNIQKGINRAVIVGGGLIGIEMAEMLHAKNIPVTMIIRERAFWNTVLPKEESEMITHHIEAKGIEILRNEEIMEIKHLHEKVFAVVCRNSKLEIDCDFLGITVGVSPNIDLAKDAFIETNKGIIVNEYLQTSEVDVYAIGDCAELSIPNTSRKSIEAIWYTGRMMGEAVANTICDAPKKYEQGIWFNSAKFFDIEYQIYGVIPSQTPEHITSLYWQHAKENKSIRLNFETKTGIITGFNLLGIRYRHGVREKWIADKINIETVLEHLPMANFDPEFSEMFEENIIFQYNQKFDKNLKIKAKRNLDAVAKYLLK